MIISRAISRVPGFNLTKYSKPLLQSSIKFNYATEFVK